ncbi:F-box/kelch-repeat protein At3g23880-like [Papaver somniferum]|uniref:F-box/kelch-repeat protein At3g23880-like n=1 Tax=Papaver somniferum TaxID=3469 RepID=UPI000E703320|nr:F-box/kelch-repeat protein At3g23880-like [Papaver somniferum]XP_026421790.1 F-box/kelch-repeat protein At3g23880-like [Papaver somniferum]
MKNLNNLPTDLLLDIIIHTPIDSILDCKLVCRSWRDLVSHHPSFSQLHLSRLNSSTDSGKTSSFIVKSRNQQLHYFEYNDETVNHSLRRFNLTLPFTSEYMVIGSFNGIVCLYKSDHTSLICNPVTRNYVVLPKFKGGCGEYVYCSSGFGYLPLTNQYKVVVLYKLRREPSFIEVAVYTLGSGKGWRNVWRSGFPFRLCYNETGVYANGALHWKENDEKGRVLVFDLTEEKFRQCLSPPPAPPKPEEGMRLNYFIGQLGGVLYCSIYYFMSDIHSDIWLLNEKEDIGDMKDQVEHEPLAWSKLFFCPGKEPLAS